MMQTFHLCVTSLLIGSTSLIACGPPGGETAPATTPPAATAGAGPAPAAAGPGSRATTPDGLEITVLDIERVKEWQMELMPGMPGPKLQTQPGNDIAVLHLGLKSTAQGAKNLDVKSLGIVDASERTHRCPIEATDICELSPQGSATCKLPCGVPETVVIAGMKAGDTIVKLTSPVPPRR